MDSSGAGLKNPVDRAQKTRSTVTYPSNNHLLMFLSDTDFAQASGDDHINI